VLYPNAENRQKDGQSACHCSGQTKSQPVRPKLPAVIFHLSDTSNYLGSKKRGRFDTLRPSKQAPKLIAFLIVHPVELNTTDCLKFHSDKAPISLA
jgi:hypothetical protein